VPIYQYECNNGHITEDFVRSYKQSKTNIKCNQCELMATRIIAPTTFKLKGDCWESDGYKGKTNRETIYDD